MGEDQLRSENHGTSHAHKLLLAARELVWEKVFLAHDVEAMERVANQAHAFFVRHILVGERNLEILEHRQVVDQVIALKDKTHVRFVKFVALFYVQLVDRFAQEVILSAPRTIQHSDNAQQRGLSRTIRTHYGHKFAA